MLPAAIRVAFLLQINKVSDITEPCCCSNKTPVIEKPGVLPAPSSERRPPKGDLSFDRSQMGLPFSAGGTPQSPDMDPQAGVRPWLCAAALAVTSLTGPPMNLSHEYRLLACPMCCQRALCTRAQPPSPTTAIQSLKAAAAEGVRLHDNFNKPSPSWGP